MAQAFDLHSQHQITIYVTCRNPNDMESMRLLKKWTSSPVECHYHHLIAQIRALPSLQQAVKTYISSQGNTILLTLGYELSDVKSLLEDYPPDDREPVIVAQPSNERHSLPSASLLTNDSAIRTSDIQMALQKACVRLRMRSLGTIRELGSEQDMEAYLKLRHDVWRQEGHLDGKPTPDTPWEIDYTDRTAYPIGAFNEHGIILGCCRLVRELGKESHKHLMLIHSLLSRSSDPELLQSFKPPVIMHHPYDILEAFSGFRSYYRKLLTRGTKVGEVSRVIVSPDYRGLGIAEALIDSLVTVASSKKISVLFLACENKTADLYRRCGFEEVPGLSSSHFINIKRPSIVMERRL